MESRSHASNQASGLQNRPLKPFLKPSHHGLLKPCFSARPKTRSPRNPGTLLPDTTTLFPTREPAGVVPKRRGRWISKPRVRAKRHPGFIVRNLRYPEGVAYKQIHFIANSFPQPPGDISPQDNQATYHPEADKLARDEAFSRSPPWMGKHQPRQTDTSKTPGNREIGGHHTNKPIP